MNQATIRKVQNGYIVAYSGDYTLGPLPEYVFKTYADAINYLAGRFNERGIGERVVLTVEKE